MNERTSNRNDNGIDEYSLFADEIEHRLKSGIIDNQTAYRLLNEIKNEVNDTSYRQNNKSNVRNSNFNNEKELKQNSQLLTIDENKPKS